MVCKNKLQYGFYGALHPNRCKQHRLPGQVPKSRLGSPPTKTGRSKQQSTPEGSAAPLPKRKRNEPARMVTPPAEPKESEDGPVAKKKLGWKTLASTPPEGGSEQNLRAMFEMDADSSPAEIKKKAIQKKCIKQGCTRKAVYASLTADDDELVLCNEHGKDLPVFNPKKGLLH
jgi:hypothetical protein